MLCILTIVTITWKIAVNILTMPIIIQIRSTVMKLFTFSIKLVSTSDCNCLLEEFQVNR